MVADFGYGILVVSFLVALYSVGAAVYGRTQPLAGAGRIGAAGHAAHLAADLAFGGLPDLSAGQQSFRGLLRLRGDQPQHAHLSEGDRLVGRTGRLAALLVVADVGLCLAGHAAQMGPRPRIPALGHRGLFHHAWPSSWRCPSSLKIPLPACGSDSAGEMVKAMIQPLASHRGAFAGRWARPEPAAAPPGHDHPPAHALSGLCLLCHPVCLRHGRAHHRPHR